MLCCGRQVGIDISISMLQSGYFQQGKRFGAVNAFILRLGNSRVVKTKVGEIWWRMTGNAIPNSSLGLVTGANLMASMTMLVSTLLGEKDFQPF